MIKLKPKGKRGSLQDLVLVMGILLTVAITIVVAALIVREIQESEMFDDRNDVNYHRARVIYNTTLNRVVPQFDNIFLGVFVAGMLGTVILGFAVRSFPIFLGAAFVFTAVLVMVAAILSNVYDEIADHPNLIGDSAQFTAIEFIFSNFPLVILGAAVLVSVAIYGLWRIAT